VDVRDRGAVHSALQRAKPDVLVHLAFILNPSHDEGFMYEVDVNGTHNVLEAAGEAGIGQVLVTTSAVAYGAFPDNPDPITEDHPVRGVARFSYARDKTESDRIVQLWALQHPDVVTTIVRPCIVFGPNVDNYLVRLWTKQPFAVDAGNLDGTIQFVHEDDVVEAISRLLLGRHEGQFNLSPEGLMTLRECAELLGTKVRRMPLRAYRGLARAMWRTRMSEAPPGQIDFALYPWVVSNEKLKKTLDWTPRYTSRETFEITMRAQGLLPPAEPPAADSPAEDSGLYSAVLPGR
jgi:UDP-glucose 4-epimerase